MYIEERHQAILDIISENGSVSTAEIQRRFKVSYDSAKRDLRILEEKGLLRRTHGGAIPVGELSVGRSINAGVSVTRLRDADSRYVHAAERAVRMIGDAGSVYIPGGEVGTAIAAELVKTVMHSRRKSPFKVTSAEHRLRVTTNSPDTALILSRSSDIKVVLVGGELTNGSAMDSFAISMLSKLRFDIAFVVSPHYSEDFGISCDGGAELGYLTALSDASRRIAAICCGDSFGSDGAVSVCATSKVCAVIEVSE